MRKTFLILAALYGCVLSCPTDWIAFRDKCFHIVLNETSHGTANDYCATMGGKLANSSARIYETFLFAVADAYEKPFWVDAPIFCTIVRYMTFTTYRCATIYNFICEMPADSLTDCYSTFEHNGFKFHFRGELFGSSCMFPSTESSLFVNDRNATEVLCGFAGGHLVNTTDKLRASYTRILAKKYNQTFWVGNDSNVCLRVSPRQDGNIGLFEWSDEGCDNTTAWLLCEAPAPEPQPLPTTPPTTTRTPEGRCPSGYNWKTLEDTCYWETSFETARMSWEQARNFCIAYGGDLASYSTSAEERLALSSAYGISRGMWMGLKKQETDNKTEYRWSDGSALNYTRWANDEPKFSSSFKRCVAHLGNESRWELSYCSIRRWFICEVPKVPQPPTSPAPPETKLTKCPGADGWYVHGDYCYGMTSTTYSWYYGKLYCEDRNARLLSIHSDEETDFVFSIMGMYPNSVYWIGLHSFGLGSSFQWTDGTTLDFANWEEGEDFSNGTIRKCAVFSTTTGSWSVKHCNYLLPVLCKKKANNESIMSTSIPPPTTPAPGYCHDGWYTLGNKCYMPFGFKVTEKKNWNESKSHCESIGASLVTVHRQEEHDLLAELVEILNSDTWIGLSTTMSGTLFHWLDDSIFDYSNWRDGEPSHYETGECCVEMRNAVTSAGTWNALSCGYSSSYICEQAKDPSLTKPGLDPTVCSGREGWFKLSQSCFAFVEERKTWLQAQSHCLRLNASLASVNSNAVTSVLTNMMAKNVSSEAWIGMRETEKSKYQFVSKIPQRYTNWLSGQPKATSESKGCVATNTGGRWLVKNCIEQLPFFCYVRLDEAEITPDYREGSCPQTKDWINIKGPSCFLFKTREVENWDTAVRHCISYGGALASLHSKQQLELIAPYLRESYSPVHIGLAKKFDGSYGWIDGTAVDFVNWRVDEPQMGISSCTQMNTGTLLWNTISCSDKQGYVCTIPKIPRNTSIPAGGEEEIKTKPQRYLGSGGIFGITIFVVTVLLAIGIGSYYVVRNRKSIAMQRLSEQDDPLSESTSHNSLQL